MQEQLRGRIGVGLPLLVCGMMSVWMASCRMQPLGDRPDGMVRGVDGAVIDDGAYFPRIASENLNGDAVVLPDDLAGDPALVLVAFKQRQQINVNTWLDRLDAIESGIEGGRVIETPTISGRKWGWMAGFIDGGMRSGIPDLEARARTITLYTDVSAFREALGLGSVDTIYGVLLDERSRVVDVVEGDFSDAKLQRLIDAL
ncbi:MAG: hypothetical protein JJ974_09020 [Phycisphaerales bacterium]|nr:hypothetical protein [Phycisphaerales bacterium]